MGALALEVSRGRIPVLDPVVLAVAKATVLQASVSTAISACVGLPLGLWLGAARAARSARAGRVLLLLPYGVPTVVAALAWVQWLGQSGLGWAYSFKAVVLAHVFFNAPLVALQVALARGALSDETLEAARLNGATWRAELRFVLWPRVRLAFESACAQVFSLCAMSFALVLILGGGPPVETLETSIYARIRFGSLDIEGALACAIWQVAIAGAPWLWVMRRGVEPRAPKAPGRRRAALRGSGFAGAALVLACALWVLPYVPPLRYLPVVFADGELAERVAGAAWVSIRLALASAALVTFVAFAAGIALLSAPSRALSLACSAPAGLSTLVLGLGAWLAYSRWIDPFEGSFGLIALIQAVLFLPFAFRLLIPAMTDVRRAQWEAAVSAGASTWSAYRWVEWPRVRIPLALAFALAFAASLGELAAVSLFYSESLVPLPLLASRLGAQYRFEQAQAVSAVLMTLALAVMSATFLQKGELDVDRSRPTR